MPFLPVARVDELPLGATKFVHAGREPLILANHEGHIHALQGLCPHRMNPLEGATMIGPLLDCPWHHFQFNVCTGENHFPRNVYPPDLPRLQEQLRPLRKYPVEIRNGEIWVEVQ